MSTARHCRSITELGPERVRALLDLTDHMAEVNRRPTPKVPALRSRLVCTLFLEDSTRTRLSFETAAKRLSADTMNFAAGQSSLNKGESLRDTIETLSAMGVDAFIVRHRSSGVPWAISQWTDAAVINAGDGWHAHPTQALLDCYTLLEELGRLGAGDRDLREVRVAMVGDIRHSRVARSTMAALEMLGAEVTMVAPRTLLPAHVTGRVAHDLDEVLDEVDVIYLLRMQSERMHGALVPDLGEYTARFGLTAERVARCGPEMILMHPGPMNRGVEITVDPADIPRSLITRQVTNGISVRMAVLFELLGSGAGQYPMEPNQMEPNQMEDVR